MAPEQATGSEIDGRTDLYAVGITLYQLVNGSVPFSPSDSSQPVSTPSSTTPTKTESVGCPDASKPPMT